MYHIGLTENMQKTSAKSDCSFCAITICSLVIEVRQPSASAALQVQQSSKTHTNLQSVSCTNSETLRTAPSLEYSRLSARRAGARTSPPRIEHTVNIEGEGYVIWWLGIQLAD